jgi:dipeptidyl aminopeptidase/acylaminoacyl peptidase
LWNFAIQFVLEWGRKMHFDLLDAVEFAVSKGIARREQIAIVGASYGGYATLVGLVSHCSC